MQKSNSKHYYNSKKLQKLISTYQLYSTDKKSVPKNMETKYLRIFTFIFFKKIDFKKKNEKGTKKSDKKTFAERTKE